MIYSKGISWFNDCRIPFVDEDSKINFDRARLREKKDWVYELGTTWENPEYKEYNTQGRFPPNLLVCDDMLNDGSVSISSNNWSKKTELQSPYFNDEKQQIQKDTSYDDKGSNSRYYDLDKWFDKMINEL